MSAAAPSASAPPRLELATHPVMDAATFQQLWGVYPPHGCAGGPMTLTLGAGAANALPDAAAASPAHLAARGFAAMAAGCAAGAQVLLLRRGAGRTRDLPRGGDGEPRGEIWSGDDENGRGPGEGRSRGESPAAAFALRRVRRVVI